MGYLLAMGEQGGEKFLAAKEIGNDESGAGAGQPLPLPWIDGEAGGLGGRNSDGYAAHLVNVFDLNVAIAKTEEFGAGEFGRGDQLCDEHLLGEAAIVIERAEDAAFEVRRDAEQFGFFAHVGLIGATGQIKPQSAVAQRLDYRARARNEIFFGWLFPAAQGLQPVVN